MKAKPWVWLALLAALAVIGYAYFGTPKPTTNAQSSLTIALESEIERLDPATIKNPKSFVLAWQIYEGLLGLDPSGKVTPLLAESWSTQDNKVWTFKIRKGVRFHESKIFGNEALSRELTADDVYWSYTKYCSKDAYLGFLFTDVVLGCADYNAGKESTVQGLKAIDATTFEVTLLHPEPFFLNRLTTAWPAIYPKEADSTNFKDKWGLTEAVGTGQYRLESTSPTEYVLVANESYWNRQAIPQVKKLTYRVISNDQARLVEFKRGALDVMTLPGSLMPAVLKSNGALNDEFAKIGSSKTIALFNTNIIGFNLRTMQDVHLRRAMNFAVDRQLLVDKVLYGHGDITAGSTPPKMNGFNSAVDPAKLFDLNKAKAELSQSTYRGEEIELLVHDQANSEQVGQILQSQWKDIGINVKLTKLDLNSAIGRAIKGDASMFSMFADIVFSSPEPMLINLFSTAKRPVPNFWQYSNASIDKMLDGLRELKTSAESVAQSAEIEARILDDVPAIFLYRQRPVILTSPKASALEVNSHGHYFFGSLPN